MSPFAGEGANLAMYDGAELGQAIAAHPDGTEAAFTANETVLLPRSRSHRGRTQPTALLRRQRPYTILADAPRPTVPDRPARMAPAVGRGRAPRLPATYTPALTRTGDGWDLRLSW
jgi:2-polyprenyl-6-methoxyphenol hydroxylase-like FAD-dependent oxidoreductase